MATPKNEFREVWEKALRLRREFGWDSAKLDRYVQGSPVALPSFSDLTLKVLETEATKAGEPNAVQTAIASFGQGASLGFTDEIGGLLSAATELDPMKWRAAYLKGRDEARAFIEAAEKANPRAAIGGNIAGALATTPLLPFGKAAQGLKSLPAIARGAGYGAAYGAAEGLGRAEDLSAESLERVAMGAGQSALVGGAATAAARGIHNVVNPGAYQVEKQVADILPELEQRMAPALATGRAPLAVELGRASDRGIGQPISQLEYLGTRSRTGPRAAESTMGKALDVARRELKAASGITKNIGTGYDVLKGTTVRDRRVWRILQRPFVRKMIADGQKSDLIPEDAPRNSFEVLHWLSGRLREHAHAQFRKKQLTGAGDTQKATRWRETADQITDVLKEHYKGFGKLEEQYARSAQQTTRLRRVAKLLETARPLSVPSPGESLKYMVKEPLGLTTAATRKRAAEGITRALYTPVRSPEELLELVKSLRAGGAARAIGPTVATFNLLDDLSQE